MNRFPIPISGRHPSAWLSALRKAFAYLRRLGSAERVPLAEPCRTPYGKLISDIAVFSRLALHRPLRAYQLEAAHAICDSVLHRRGLTFAVVMPRQAGKNELSAQVEAYLLHLHRRRGGQIIKVAPTYLPQALTSATRLDDRLRDAGDRPRRPQPHIRQLGQARALFLSAHPTANVLGATADLLLECDEAQDVDPARWDRDFAPMAASTGATRVFYGTPWTGRTLLAREMRHLRELEARDGLRRVFLVPWERVAAEVRPYGRYVRDEIARLGLDHPAIRTQYLLQEIDAEAGMFPPARSSQMRGHHPPESAAAPDALYALLVDVAGEDEAADSDPLAATRRDSTALTVVRLDLSTVPTLGLPTYRVVHRRRWTGTPHPALYGALLDLARHVWHARYVVVDATGVGAGLASFLARALGERVVPYLFTARSKSDLGWGFLAVVDTGRFKDHAPCADDDQAQFWREVEACEYEVVPGVQHLLRWGVPDPTVHDDLLISAALCAALDQLPWRYETRSYLLEPEA